VDDEDGEEKRKQRDKPRLVILGCGWGSVAMLKTINPENYHITVVSPSNYFLFTPLLPSATVGTLEVRSIMEPIRRIIRGVGGHFLKAAAEDVEFSEKLVEVSQSLPNGEKRHFYVPYDKLVIAVGKWRPLILGILHSMLINFRVPDANARRRGARTCQLPQECAGCEGDTHEGN
jgi:NADH dehydrogenase